jgi:hypothetical protein
MRTFVRFSWSAPEFDVLKATSQAILKREPLFLSDATSVSYCMKPFAERCVSLPVPQNCETQFLYDIIEALCPRYHWKQLTSLVNLSARLREFLHLTVAPHQVVDPFPVYVVPATRTVISVLQGCYITQYAQHLLIRNRDLVDGLIMDATRKIIGNCVASILMLSIANAAIPVALAMARKRTGRFINCFTPWFVRTLAYHSRATA